MLLTDRSLFNKIVIVEGSISTKIVDFRILWENFPNISEVIPWVIGLNTQSFKNIDLLEYLNLIWDMFCASLSIAVRGR